MFCTIFCLWTFWVTVCINQRIERNCWILRVMDMQTTVIICNYMSAAKFSRDSPILEKNLQNILLHLSPKRKTSFCLTLFLAFALQSLNSSFPLKRFMPTKEEAVQFNLGRTLREIGRAYCLGNFRLTIYRPFKIGPNKQRFTSSINLIL